MLSFLTLLALSIGGLTLYAAFNVVYGIFFHPLRQYPGPITSKFTSVVWAYQVWIGNLPHWIAGLHDKYGDVVRIKPTELSYIDAQAWTDIYGHRQPNGVGNLPKDYSKQQINPNNTPSIITANDEDHRRMRRLQSHMFSEKALSAQESLINSYVSKLISQLYRQVGNDESAVVDILKWYNFTTFDILGDLAFGDSFSCLDSSTLHPWIAIIFASIKNGSYEGISRELSWPLNKLVDYFTPVGLKNGRADEFAFAQNKARERLSQGNTDREDFMSYILRFNDEKGMTVPEIESNSSLLIIAGSETTATFLSGITYNLLLNPTIMTNLTTLIRTTFATESEISVLSIQRLDYFTCVLEEGFRTYPPVPINLTRLTQGEGNMICGKWVAGGVNVGVAPMAATRSAKNFKDPEKFVPERWAKDGAVPDRYKGDNRNIMQPFSFGPKNCIGRNLAYAEMRLILARVLWNFDMELQPDCKKWDQQKVFSLWEKVPLNIKLIPRKL